MDRSEVSEHRKRRLRRIRCRWAITRCSPSMSPSRRFGPATRPISRTCRSRRRARWPARRWMPTRRAIRDLAYLGHPRPQPHRRGGRALGGPPDATRSCCQGLRDMMTLRAFDARMQMAQRQGKTSFYMQHMGEEAISCAFRKALLPGDMNFPDLSPGRAADRRRLSARRHDVPDLLERARPAERPAAAGALLRQGPRLLLDLREPGDPVHPGGRLGDGLGHQERHQDRCRLDRRRLDGGSPISTRRLFSPRPTRLPSSSTSSTTNGRSRPFRASPGAAPAHSRPAALASASRPCGSTATTIWPSMRSPNGRRSGHAAISGRR